MYQPVVVQKTVIIQNQQFELLSCPDIFCHCKPPQFYTCQCLNGFCIAISCGICLQCAACETSYGPNRQDRCEMYLAGFGFTVTSPFIYGIIASFIVGLRMMQQK